MKTLRAMLVRFRGLFRRTLETEMNEELRGHIDALTERNLAAGLSPGEARYAALRTFGGVAQIAERARDERRSAWATHGVNPLIATPSTRRMHGPTTAHLELGTCASSKQRVDPLGWARRGR